jgi:hypothetical protein
VTRMSNGFNIGASPPTVPRPPLSPSRPAPPPVRCSQP